VDKVESLDLQARRIRVRRMLEGAREIVEAPLPALLSVVKEINEPRYASLPDLIRGCAIGVPVWTAADIGLTAEDAGLQGSPTQVRRIFARPAAALERSSPGRWRTPIRLSPNW